jgi:hypothetical protein
MNYKQTTTTRRAEGKKNPRTTPAEKKTRRTPLATKNNKDYIRITKNTTIFTTLF